MRAADRPTDRPSFVLRDTHILESIQLQRSDDRPVERPPKSPPTFRLFATHISIIPPNARNIPSSRDSSSPRRLPLPPIESKPIEVPMRLLLTTLLPLPPSCLDGYKNGVVRRIRRDTLATRVTPTRVFAARD